MKFLLEINHCNRAKTFMDNFEFKKLDSTSSTDIIRITRELRAKPVKTIRYVEKFELFFRRMNKLTASKIARDFFFVHLADPNIFAVETRRKFSRSKRQSQIMEFGGKKFKISTSNKVEFKKLDSFTFHSVGF